MGLYLLRRLLGGILVLLGVSFAIYVALAAAPGDAADSLLGERATVEQLALVRQELGLSRPLLLRYLDFLTGVVLRGDLGRSLASGRAVKDLLAERFPYTLVLSLAAMGLAIVLGMGIGILAAYRPGGPGDLLVMGVAALGIAVPVYWVGLLFIMVFSLRLGWLPVAGSGSLSHLVLPAITLALPTAAIVARLMRASLLEVRDADFLRTAYSKGLRPSQVFVRHALPNSLIPVITILGLHLGHLLGGAFVVETIFAWPGLGRLAVQAVFDRDSPVVLGSGLLVAAINVALNLVVDLVQAILDPRLRQEAL